MKHLTRECTVCDTLLPLMMFDHHKQRVERNSKPPIILGTFDDVCCLCLRPMPLADFVNSVKPRQ